MAKTVSDFLVERLYQWGVRRVYGYPGDGINGIMGALNRPDGKIEFIQSRHEELAAFEACAHAKFTGEVGVCMATSGPGAIHLLNGLYDAKMDHQPVVAIVGQTEVTALGTDYQQEVDLISLFKDVANNYVHMAGSPVQIRHLVDRAFRIAQAERTVTCIIIPNDIQEMEAVELPPRKHGATVTGRCYTQPDIIPHEEDLKQAADILNSGKKVAMLVGAGALARDGRGHADGRSPGGGRGQGAPGKGGPPGRSALCDRLHRPARDEAELGHDDGLRHLFHDRVGLPLFGIPAQGGPGPGGPDRHQGQDAEPPVPHGGLPAGRHRPDPPGAPPHAESQVEHELAQGHRARMSRNGGR